MNECLRLLDYGPYHIEQFIVACTGKVNWRADFMLGLAVMVFVVAFLFMVVMVFGRNK